LTIWQRKNWFNGIDFLSLTGEKYCIDGTFQPLKIKTAVFMGFFKHFHLEILMDTAINR
jgi:hypothetical protein